MTQPRSVRIGIQVFKTNPNFQLRELGLFCCTLVVGEFYVGDSITTTKCLQLLGVDSVPTVYLQCLSGSGLNLWYTGYLVSTVNMCCRCCFMLSS